MDGIHQIKWSSIFYDTQHCPGLDEYICGKV